MKTAIHKTFEKDEDGKRQVTLYASDGMLVEKILGKNVETWVASVPPQSEFRFTSVHAQDPLINDLVSKGHKVLYTSWRTTGIPKDLTPSEIVVQFALLPENVFREFQSRPDLCELRYRVNQRLAVIEYRKAAILKLKGNARNFGAVNEDELSDEIKQLLADAETGFNVTKIVKGKEKQVSIDNLIASLAENIEECQLFNKAARITGAWNTAAAVVALSGGIDRFDDVASLWRYAGQDPTSFKLKKGRPCQFNPKLKTILWQMSDSIIKNRNNPWRDYYDLELEKEIAVHAQKHPDCKTPKGHCMARAKMKMRKEILKRFFLAVKGEEFRADHCVKTRHPVLVEV